MRKNKERGSENLIKDAIHAYNQNPGVPPTIDRPRGQGNVWRYYRSAAIIIGGGCAVRKMAIALQNPDWAARSRGTARATCLAVGSLVVPAIVERGAVALGRALRGVRQTRGRRGRDVENG